MKRNGILFLILILFFATGSIVNAQDSKEPEQDAESVVTDLYRLVSVEKGSRHNWDLVRELFHEDATVVLRTSMTASTVFDLEGFIADFERFVNDYNVIETGFIESIVKMKPVIFGDIATIMVVYEASIPGSGRPPQKGLDSMHLIKVDGRWKIISIVNEIPTPARPLPEELKD